MAEKTGTQRVDLNELKSGGFIKQNQRDLFTVRLKVPGGRITPDRMLKIAEVAKKYSRMGFCHLSFRQSVEIVGVHIDDFDAVVKELAAVGQKVASCGPRVRVPTACGGCEYNPNGIMDTQSKALEVDEKFFGIACPHKFKIGFSGCPIDCTRTREMDLGFQGVVYPVWGKDLCNGCTLCAKACQEGAIISDKEGRPVFDESKCVYCGDCIRACPTDAWKDKKKGWLVRTGGKHGRHPREADEVLNFLPDNKVNDFVDATVKWYKEHGKPKERIGSCIARVGLEKFKKDVVGTFIKN